MKNIFKDYYKLGDKELQSLWENAQFIFDTSVLLNLYRYQSTTSNELFTVMKSLADRVWIPYHVGLEFQRNRLNVIGEQHEKFSKVKKIVGNSIDDIQKNFNNLQLEKRHSLINPDEFLKRIEEIRNDFFQELDKLENQSINIHSEDKIRNRIDALFTEKIGNKPEDQKEIDKIFREGETRYKNQIPPGYEDSSKDAKSPDTFTYAGIIYQRKYGDLIIWKQIMCYARKHSIKNLIFVIDDQKDDWWWEIDSNGPKTIGVRPELTDEIFREAGVENFHVFNSGGFLYYANKQPDVQVAEEAIKEVREVSDVQRARIMHPQAIRQLELSVEKAVYEWLSNNFPHFVLEQNGRSQPDFIGYHDDRKYGFEVRLVQTRHLQIVMYRLREMIYRFYYMLNEEGFYEIAIIFVVLDEEIIPELRSLIERGMLDVQENLRIIIGKAEYSEEEGQVYDFTPYDDFNLGDRPG